MRGGIKPSRLLAEIAYSYNTCKYCMYVCQNSSFAIQLTVCLTQLGYGAVLQVSEVSYSGQLAFLLPAALSHFTPVMHLLPA